MAGMQRRSALQPIALPAVSLWGVTLADIRGSSPLTPTPQAHYAVRHTPRDPQLGGGEEATQIAVYTGTALAILIESAGGYLDRRRETQLPEMHGHHGPLSSRASALGCRYTLGPRYACIAAGDPGSPWPGRVRKGELNGFEYYSTYWYYSTRARRPARGALEEDAGNGRGVPAGKVAQALALQGGLRGGEGAGSEALEARRMSTGDRYTEYDVSADLPVHSTHLGIIGTMMIRI
eukprot:CAMPEP_0183373190 /NCGR_PEP_ID=MMETSP0164_2-20130417/110738_1 /TAXON_ID=221442 /ORGANISM="Coccolithus pelagicus ssp braarudi, Strain PLY182g" /LENGTH=234 /DNA_ID=CAMNT_0025550031 /DNA_START=1 /DNA_END=709 /DNA_ORIENTATION=+